MVSKTRKVSFYRLSLEKQTLLPGTRTVRVTQLNNSEIEDCFREIYNEKMQVLSDNHKAINITASNGHYVIEAISFEEHRAFLKIGQQNPSNTVALRDRTTLETENVPMRESQLLELYTFCLIDFESGIVSYIGINGAPKISVIDKERIERLWNNSYLDNLYRSAFVGTIANIITIIVAFSLVFLDIPSKAEDIFVEIEIAALIIGVVFFAWCIKYLLFIISKLKTEK